MEKLNMLREGGSNLPPGLRFEPTDEEIVFHYLAPKIFSSPLPVAPHSLIPHFHNIHHYPTHLPHSYQDRYFFTNINRRTNLISSSKPNGHWKVIAPHKLIRSKRTPVLGIKKTFLFYQRNRNTTHHCFMHLYCIALSPNSSTNQGSLVQIGNWVFCHVYFKKKSTNIARVSNHKRTYEQFMTQEISDTDSSCASSSDSNSDSDSSVLSEVSSSAASETDSGLDVQSP